MSETPEQSALVETINSQQYIRVLLEQAVKRRNLVNISYPEKQLEAISTLLKVEGDEQTFLLDGPYIPNGVDAKTELSKADVIHISGKSRGTTLNFQAEFREVIHEAGLKLYRLAFPREIAFAAQRASHRVDTSDFDTLISFTTSSGYSFSAPLCDISDGGLRVRAGRDVIKSITRGDQIYCALDIDESCRKLQVKLCKPSKVKDPNLIEFGATFIDLLPHQKKQISHYIAGLERQLLRKQHAIPEPMPLTEFSATGSGSSLTSGSEL